jgi:hypothetical protein
MSVAEFGNKEQIRGKMTSMTFLLLEMIGILYCLQIYHSSLHFKSIYDSVTRPETSTTRVFFFAISEYTKSTETRDLFIVQGGRLTILQGNAD